MGMGLMVHLVFEYMLVLLQHHQAMVLGQKSILMVSESELFKIDEALSSYSEKMVKHTIDLIFGCDMEMQDSKEHLTGEKGLLKGQL
jgi:hypothetical protein